MNCGPEVSGLYRKRWSEKKTARFLMCGGAFDSDLKEAAFVRGGRYGMSIDFGLEVVGKTGSCVTTLKSKFSDISIKPGSTIRFIVNPTRTIFQGSYS
jgi:hypothetical protein